MPEFQYKIRDGQGRVVDAVAQAESSTVLKARLTSRGLDVLEIQSKGGFDFNRSWDSFTLLFETVSLKELLVFARQFSAMVSSGVATLRTLTIVVEQCKNRKMKSTIDEVRRSV